MLKDMIKKMSKKQFAAEIAGWYGAIAILAGYALVTFDIVKGDSLVFQLLNLTGALGVLIIALYKKVGQSVILNVFWAAIAAIAIINILLI